MPFIIELFAVTVMAISLAIIISVVMRAGAYLLCCVTRNIFRRKD